MGLLPYQERVVAERDDLVKKLNLLKNFFTTPTFNTLSDAERKRLHRQSEVMKEYVSILDERIADFTH